MDFKKLFMGGIIGGILYFGLGYLVYGKLMMTFFADHPGENIMVQRAQTELKFLYIAVGSLLQGFLLAYIFVRANISSAASGFITGGVIGALSSAGMDSIMYGTTKMLSKTAMAGDVVAAAVMTAVIGAILGVIMGMGKKTS